MLTIRASSLDFRCGRNARVRRTTAAKLISISQSKSASLTWSKVRASATPALLEHQINAAVLGRDRLRQGGNPARSATSSLWREMRMLAPSTSCTVSAKPGSLISTRARWQPRLASACAIARPMPLPAPVIKRYGLKCHSARHAFPLRRPCLVTRAAWLDDVFLPQDVLECPWEHA